jgi:hypothetical protein
VRLKNDMYVVGGRVEKTCCDERKRKSRETRPALFDIYPSTAKVGGQATRRLMNFISAAVRSPDHRQD